MASPTSLPPQVALVRDFVNTYELDGDTETLGDPAALTAWLRAHDLLGTHEVAGAQDVERARELREALRAALIAHHDGVAPRQVRDRLDRLAAALPLRLTFTDEPPALVPGGSGAAAGLAGVLAAVAGAAADGSWQRLKVCPADDCRWAFYDASRNRSRTWCSMEVCGNRTKTRTYRARHRDGDAG